MDEASAIDQISMLHLRYFLAVAEEGTVRAASERIGISQPSLSQQVAQLERRLGVRLFDRSSSGMRLSDAGNLLVGVSTRTIQALNDLGQHGIFVQRVGVPRGIDRDTLDSLVHRFGAHVSFKPIDSSRAEKLLGREIDAAIVRGPLTLSQPHTTTEQLRTAPLGVLVQSDHHLAAQQQINWAELLGQSLLWFDERRAPEYAKWLLDYCRSRGWRPAPHRLDPAGSTLVANALRTSSSLVALQPQDPRPADGLTWVPLKDAPLEELLLISTDHHFVRH